MTEKQLTDLLDSMFEGGYGGGMPSNREVANPANMERFGIVKKRWFNIRVKYSYPPIPDRRWDWCAYYEGEEEKGNYGEGSTPYMAIFDLINNQNPTVWWEKQNG